MQKTDRTIIGLCTPLGSGAIALLRISGPKAIFITDKLSNLTSKKKLSACNTHTIHHAHIVDKENNSIDEVLILLMKQPNTFTGEETIEITCHNNQFIINAIIEEYISLGAYSAGPGEFSRQAVLNNKMDFVQAEAINELIHANNQTELKKALSQLKGTLSNFVYQIEEKILLMLSLSQASFEFIEEDEMDLFPSINAHLTELLNVFTKVKICFNAQKQIREGIRISLIGTVNSGKSSLFNCLIEQERAIVTDIPGTTRDVIEAGSYYKDGYVTFVDTAGIRKTNEKIEKIGIDNSYKQAALSDIILLIFDGSRPIIEYEKILYKDIYKKYKNKILFIQTKSDLKYHKKSLPLINVNPDIVISSQTKDNIDYLRSLLNKKIKTLFQGTSQLPFLLNKRHYSLLLKVENILQEVASIMKKKPIAYELISHNLNDALHLLSEVTGKTASEAAMDKIFQEFCIGK